MYSLASILLQTLWCSLNLMLIEGKKPLAPFTTFGIGGPARWFAEAASEDEIVEATGWAAQRDVPLFVLGGGSNLLVSDSGFDGLVLRMNLRGIQAIQPNGPRNEPDDPWIYHVAAGEDWDRFVQRTVEDNCAGIECLAGIPGTVGGTPVQNVGAYGQEVASAIVCVRAFDLQAQAFVEFAAAECGFAYRRSRFNTRERGVLSSPAWTTSLPKVARRRCATLTCNGRWRRPRQRAGKQVLQRWRRGRGKFARRRGCCSSRAIRIATARAASSRIPWSARSSFGKLRSERERTTALSRRSGARESRQSEAAGCLAD